MGYAAGARSTLSASPTTSVPPVRWDHPYGREEHSMLSTGCRRRWDHPRAGMVPGQRRLRPATTSAPRARRDDPEQNPLFCLICPPPLPLSGLLGLPLTAFRELLEKTQPSWNRQKRSYSTAGEHRGRSDLPRRPIRLLPGRARSSEREKSRRCVALHARRSEGMKLEGTRGGGQRPSRSFTRDSRSSTRLASRRTSVIACWSSEDGSFCSGVLTTYVPRVDCVLIRPSCASSSKARRTVSTATP